MVKRKDEFDVFEIGKNKVEGTIKRTVFNESTLGNWNTGTISVLGKRYKIIGKNVSLPKSVILKLKAKGELK